MRLRIWLFVGFLALVLTACGQALGASSTEVASPTLASVLAATEAPTASVIPTSEELPAATRVPTATAVPTATQAPSVAAEPTPSPSPSADNADTPESATEVAFPPGADEFKTDFSKHSVSYDEILSGGPPKDGIPAIDSPKFVGVDEADDWLQPQEPVILFEVGGDARAYPIQILTWHEIVNDTVGGVPVTVTFCPLCNTGIAFDRTFDDQVLDFGTTGRLRFLNLIMYDRQTETWWQQATGEAIAGEHTGRQLTFLPAPMISWEGFKTTHPDGRVLSRDTGFVRNYGSNPYPGYDDISRPPFRIPGGPETPGVLPPMARVFTVELNGETVAYPFDVLQEVHVANDTVGDTPLVVFWDAGTASALDESTIAGGRDVGAVNSFSRELDGQTLTFSFEDGKILDEKTGSEWDVLGQAVSGPLAGSQLTPIVGVNHFWFSWAAFKPETRIYEAS